MNFGNWHDVVDAPRVAPEQSGVLQARARTLLSFPTGKSAMVLYDASSTGETLRRYVDAAGAPRLARAVAAGATLIRFGITPHPEGELQRLLRQFADRFGALPPGNRESASESVVPAESPTQGSPKDGR